MLMPRAPACVAGQLLQARNSARGRSNAVPEKSSWNTARDAVLVTEAETRWGLYFFASLRASASLTELSFPWLQGQCDVELDRSLDAGALAPSTTST